MRRMSELKGRFELMSTKLIVEKEETFVDRNPVHLYRDDSDDDYGLDVPASAEEEDRWDTLSEHSGVSGEEGPSEDEEGDSEKDEEMEDSD